MKELFGLLRPRSKTAWLLCIVMGALGFLITLAQLWSIHSLWTPVGFVDTWPLYDRLMHLREGNLSLDHYFFDPHGPHLHFIIYFLYLIDVTISSGRQLVPHYATIICTLGLIALLLYLGIRSLPAHLPSSTRLAAFLFATPILLSGLSDATIIPFQAIVVVSNFIYAALLALLVWCHYYPNRRLYTLAMIGSCIAASFYAASGIFAIEVILLHVVLLRKRRMLLYSVLPLICYLFLIHRYLRPTAETLAIAAILAHLNLLAIFQIAVGAVCYYATPFVAGSPRPIQLRFGTWEFFIFGVAAVVSATTVIWAVHRLIHLALKFRRNPDLRSADDIPSCVLSLLSLSVVASSLSASLLWLARVRVADAFHALPPHFAVLTSSRYSAFGAVALIVFVYILMTVRRNWASVIAVALFVLVAATSANTLINNKFYYDLRTQLDDSATALLMGMTPIDHEANAVWPGVAADPYWAAELPSVSKYLQAAGISYAYQMPTEGQQSRGRSVPLLDYSTQPVEGGALRRLVNAGQTAAFNLTDPNWRNGVWLSKGAMFIVDARDLTTTRIALGDELRFAKSGSRTVVHIGSGSPVPIEVSGSNLDPAGDGYPHLVTVKEWRTDTGETICRLNGSIASFPIPNPFAPQRFFPISNASGNVVGYVVRTGRNISGHMNCAAAVNHPGLFLSEIN